MRNPAIRASCSRGYLRRAGANENIEPAGEAPVEPPGEPVIRFAGWRLDLVSRILHDQAGVLINLSDGEFRLLRAFVEHPRRVLTRDQLLDYARGQDVELYDRHRLRRKLGNSGPHEESIRTVAQSGAQGVEA